MKIPTARRYPLFALMLGLALVAGSSAALALEPNCQLYEQDAAPGSQQLTATCELSEPSLLHQLLAWLSGF